MLSKLHGRSFLVVFSVFAFMVPTLNYRIFSLDMRSNKIPNQPSPVIMIPGDGGCQAFAEFKDSKSPPFPLWVDLRYLITPSTFGKYFRLVYDSKTRRSHDNEYARIQFPGWGETWPVDNLDTRPHDATKYFGDVTEAFKASNPFYISNFTLRSAPFDFRKAPNENEDFVPKMKQLVEETYDYAGNSRVVIVGHSMGTLYGLHFLKGVPESWKKKYVKAYVGISGPLGGSMKALKIEASGDNFGIYFESSLWYRELQRSMPSLAFLLPDLRLWPPTEPIIITPKRNYSAHDYEVLFKDMGFPEGYEMFKDTKYIVDGFEGPTGVDEVYCFHGVNISTPESMIYSEATTFRSAFPDQNPTLTYENGDGTVNLRSLIRCSDWKGVKYAQFNQAEHLRILRDPRLLDQLLNIANAKAQVAPSRVRWLARKVSRWRPEPKTNLVKWSDLLVS